MMRGNRSIEGYLIRGHGNMSQQRLENRDRRTNGCISLDLEAAGFSRDIQVFRNVYNKLRNDPETKGITKKNFAVSWHGDFMWLYLRENVFNGLNEATFDPAWICSICNKYYSENPRVRVGLKNKYMNPIRILDQTAKPPQKTSIVCHGRSEGHRIAEGIEASQSDHTVFNTVYFEAYFNIPALTHPFFLYLIDMFEGDVGLQLHSPPTAKKITICVGAIVRSAVVQVLREAPFVTFGEDGADIKNGSNLFWIWVRTVIGSEPIQLFWAVRRELRQKSDYLFDVFMDSLSGRDIEYGYDYKKKIEYETIQDYNDEIKKRPKWSKKDLKTFKAPQNVKVLQDFEKQYHGALKIGERVVSKTLCNVSDGAPNQFSDINGFNGLLMDEQRKYLNTVIMERVHCDNHEWDLHCKIVKDSGVELLIDIIEECRQYMNYADVYEQIIKVAVIYNIPIATINKYFNKRWIMHCCKALGSFICIIDILINVMIWNLNKLINRNDADSLKRKELVLDLLQRVCDNYWLFMIYYPVIMEAGVLSVNTQSWSKTCVDAANYIDAFYFFCAEYPTNAITPEIKQRKKSGTSQHKLLCKNVEKLKKLNKLLKDRDIIAVDIELDLDYKSLLFRGKSLCDEYKAGLDSFKSYKVWCRYRTLVDIEQWELDIHLTTDNMFSDNGKLKKTFNKLYTKYKLHCDKTRTWIQYKRFVKIVIGGFRNKIKEYDYYDVIVKALENKLWRQRNGDLALVFFGLFIEGFSNNFAESLGHLGNVITPAHRKIMGILLLDAIMHIKVNGLAIDQSSGIASLAIDFWYKSGYFGADAIWGDKQAPKCKDYVERYLDYEIDEDDEKKASTDYERRLLRKQKRQSILKEMYKSLDKVLKQRAESVDDDVKDNDDNNNAEEIVDFLLDN